MFTPGNLLLTTTIVLLILGGKKIRTLGEDLGVAIKSFREAVREKPVENTEDSTQMMPKE